MTPEYTSEQMQKVFVLLLANKTEPQIVRITGYSSVLVRHLIQVHKQRTQERMAWGRLKLQQRHQHLEHIKQGEVMVDAIREVLGFAPLYADEPEITYCSKHTRTKIKPIKSRRPIHRHPKTTSTLEHMLNHGHRTTR